MYAVRAGSYLSHAAEYAGVSRETVYTWLERGRTERTRLNTDPKAKPNPTEAAYLAFSDTVMRAESEAVVEAVGLWRGAAEKDWRAAKEWLARRHGAEWGDKARVEHTGANGAPITFRGLADILRDNADDDDNA